MVCALASFGPDASTNTTVAIKDCEEKPATQVKLEISVRFIWGESGLPVKQAFGSLFISHQKVINNEECTYTVDFVTIVDYITDDEGNFNYVGPTWTHDNSQDLIRVEIYRSGHAIDGYYSYKESFVGVYNQGLFSFYDTVYPIL